MTEKISADRSGWVDLRDALNAAAEAMHEDWRARNTTTALSPWENSGPMHQHAIRESILPAITAAAPLIEQAVREDIDARIAALADLTGFETPAVAIDCARRIARGETSTTEEH